MTATQLEQAAAKLYHTIYPKSNYYRATWQQRQRFLEIVRYGN
jgi:hypothetical protein